MKIAGKQNLTVGPSRSFTDPETQRESLLGGTNSFAGQFIHPSLAQSSRSIQHMQTVQVPKQDSHLLPVFCGTKSRLHRSRNSGREFAWWNQLLCRSFLIPISFTKLKIHSAHPDSPIVPKQVFFYLVLAIWKGDQSMLHRSRNSGRDFWWNQLPCGPVLTPISCTKFKIHSVLADSLIVPEQVSSKSCTGNLDEGPVYASHIK